MIRTILLALILTSAIGCSGIKSSVTNLDRPQDKIIANPAFALYLDNGGDVGPRLVGDTKGIKVGQEVQIVKTAHVSWVSAMNKDGITIGRYAMFNHNGTPYWAKSFDIDEKGCLEAYEANGLVTVPKASGDDAWSRAVSWATENSDTKIQTSSDYAMETYNPVKDWHTAHSVYREVRGDSVTIRLSSVGPGNRPVNCQFYNRVKYGR